MFPVADGKYCAASHTKAEKNGGEKGHEGVGGAHGRQSVASEKLADDKGIGDIIELLEKIAYHKGKSKKQHGLCNAAGSQISLHGEHLLFMIYHILTKMAESHISLRVPKKQSDSFRRPGNLREGCHGAAMFF